MVWYFIIMAKKLKPIAKTVHIGKATIIRLASKVIDMVFQDTVFKHKGVDGKKFAPYSESYKERKGNLGTGGVGGLPDLTLSGRMMGSLLIRKGQATEDDIPVGWISPKSKQKLKWNESIRGKLRKIVKDIGTFPFAKHIETWFKKEIDKKLDKNVKSTSERVTFDIKM